MLFDSDVVLKKKTKKTQNKTNKRKTTKPQAGRNGIQSANVQELFISAFVWFKEVNECQGITLIQLWFIPQ